MAAAAAASTAATAAPPAGGRVIVTGDCNWSMIGRKAPTAAFDGITTAGTMGFHQVDGLQEVAVRQVVSGPVACHNVAITAAGAVYVWGRNETGQLGLGDTHNRYNPVPLVLPGAGPVVAAACGSSPAGPIPTLAHRAGRGGCRRGAHAAGDGGGRALGHG